MVIYSGFSHEKWWCSIAMLVHQRISKLIAVFWMEKIMRNRKNLGATSLEPPYGQYPYSIPWKWCGKATVSPSLGWFTIAPNYSVGLPRSPDFGVKWGSVTSLAGEMANMANWFKVKILFLVMKFSSCWHHPAKSNKNNLPSLPSRKNNPCPCTV